jgi:hypothetical protein
MSFRRGWRATAAGARDDSALLALAPLVLQDLAVTAADAVAAAYLADAVEAAPSLAAVAGAEGAASPLSAPISNAASSFVQQAEGSRQQQAPQQPGMQQSSAAVPSAPTPAGGALSQGGSEVARTDATQTSRSATGRRTSGSPLEAGWWPTFVHPRLGSTRQLQRFANRVALQRWVEVRWGLGLALALAWLGDGVGLA